MTITLIAINNLLLLSQITFFELILVSCGNLWLNILNVENLTKFPSFPIKQVFYYSHFIEHKKCVPQCLSDLPKVTQPASGKRLYP